MNYEINVSISDINAGTYVFTTTTSERYDITYVVEEDYTLTY